MNWVSAFYEIAKGAGYDFAPGEIGQWIKPLVDLSGREEVERTWKYYCENVADEEDTSKWISPRQFARKYGWWRRQASPVT